MKKVLIVANLFHASPRVPCLAKYLPEFGWQQTILSTPLGDRPDEQFGPPNDFRETNRVIEVNSPTNIGVQAKRDFSKKKKYKRIKPLLKFFYRRYSEIANYPDEEKGWKPFAIKAGDELLKNETMNAMISSSSPVTCHLVAKELKERYRIPWVADFRDLWTQNHNYPYSILRRSFERRLERKTLSVADAFVVVCPPDAEKLKTLHSGKRIKLVTNGFDPEKMNVGKVSLQDKFTITYTGQIYEKQDPLKLLSALRDLVLREKALCSDDIEVRFFGPRNESFADKIEQHELSNIVHQFGVVPRDVSYEKQRESQILLLMKWEDAKQQVCTGKIFEYFGAGRPILATGGYHDVVSELLFETSAGIDAPNIEDIKSALKGYYEDYKRNGEVSYQGKMEMINKYSYREMARKYADILEEINQ